MSRKRNRNKAATLVALVATGVVLLTAAAWACVAGPSLVSEPQGVAAGEEVQISGITWNPDLPVVIRFNALDGPVLGEFMPDPDSRRLAGSVEIPAGTEPGNYVLIGTQESADGEYRMIPARALVSVHGAGGAPLLGAPLEAQGADRPAGLASAGSASTGSLVLAGLGVAGVALFVAGAGAFLTTRKRPEPKAATVDV
ncbi:MAG: hypothetical protein WD232_03050 [Acidimicrobiales bacterium]